MEQRRLRLGDILDDYCPRERRVTNHAVVAMVEEDVKQTRCTTCDTEHVYKRGKAPRQRKLEGPGKLYKQVLAGLTDQPVVSAVTVDDDMMDEPEQDNDTIEAIADVVPVADGPREQRDAVRLADDEPAGTDDSDDEPQPSFDDGPVHRPLIRAQLPRVEGVKLERQAPDFTIRQNSNGRGSNFRGAQGHGGGGSNNGQRFGRGPFRDRGGSGGGGGRGANQGFGRGPGGGGGGPRKRGR